MTKNKLIIIYKILEDGWESSFRCEEPSEEITTECLVRAIKKLTWSEIWTIIKIKIFKVQINNHQDEERKYLFKQQGYKLLQIGDSFKNGDIYGWGFCFMIGTLGTSFKEGSKITQEIMCYYPRRKIN